MVHVQTQSIANGVFRTLDGRPEDHGLIAIASYSFIRDGERWIVFMANEPVMGREELERPA